MKLSTWNQYWEHKENVSLPPSQVFNELMQYYKQSSKSFELDNEDPPLSFSFHRGNSFVSALGIGSELWCKHYVDVYIEETRDGRTEVLWKINLKLFGFQTGSNAIVEECKHVIANVA